jgi:hypothetical protein
MLTRSNLLVKLSTSLEAAQLRSDANARRYFSSSNSQVYYFMNLRTTIYKTNDEFLDTITFGKHIASWSNK